MALHKKSTLWLVNVLWHCIKRLAVFGLSISHSAEVMTTGAQSNGQTILEGISTKLEQLQDKIKAFNDLLSVWCSYEKYHDDFLIYVMPDGEFNLTFRWFCYKLIRKLSCDTDDTRDHEFILREHFKKFNLLIQKEDYSWKVIVSTPVNQPSVKCVSLTIE